MSKQFFFTGFLSLISFLSFSQYQSKFQQLTLYNSIGYVKYFDTDETKETLKNRSGFTLNLSCIYENNISFSSSYNYNKSTLAKPISFGVYLFPSNTSFFVNTFESHVGYCFRLTKNVILETYSGICETSILIADENDDIVDKYFKTGVPLGLRVSYLVKLAKKSDYKLALYFSNNASYNRMNRINPNFSNFGYSVEVGIGLVKEEIVFKTRDGRVIKI